MDFTIVTASYNYGHYIGEPPVPTEVGLGRLAPP